ncbi:hypothetical protein HJB51_29105 [Rhizobium lentis]|uniref:hypothetical protein n=1 Tax=Rhizobium lentis TaxID=1138194 RepID=UPI001C83A6D0|nr:hypothetical protein [Rhizobium lentis]MBX5111992.1 hypothetical protein [Rhizobium lentis]
MSGTATLYALATFICMHPGTAYETCVPYAIKGFATEEMCLRSAHDLQTLLVSIGKPGSRIVIDGDCGTYNPSNDQSRISGRF